jgi:hypothetical protein
MERLGDRGRRAEVVHHRLEGSVAVGTVCDRLKQLAGANEVDKRVSIVAGRRNEKYYALSSSALRATDHIERRPRWRWTSFGPRAS